MTGSHQTIFGANIFSLSHDIDVVCLLNYMCHMFVVLILTLFSFPECSPEIASACTAGEDSCRVGVVGTTKETPAWQRCWRCISTNQETSTRTAAAIATRTGKDDCFYHIGTWRKWPTFSNAFCWNKVFVFWFKFHWFVPMGSSNLHEGIIGSVMACHKPINLLTWTSLTKFYDAIWRH